MVTTSRATAAYFDAAHAVCGQPKLVANWIMGEISKRLNSDGGDIASAPVTPQVLGALIGRIQGRHHLEQRRQAGLRRAVDG